MDCRSSAFASSRPATRFPTSRAKRRPARSSHSRARSAKTTCCWRWSRAAARRCCRCPQAACPMADLKAVTRELLACGAPIQDMNTVRKHLSAIQGGRLAAATTARVLALIISDVTGDDPTHIASGPCVADPTTYRDALDILARYGVQPPQSVARISRAAREGAFAETPKPGDATLARAENRVIATAHASLMKAAAFVQHHGITPMVLGDSVTGESSEVAKVYAALARQVRAPRASVQAARGAHLRRRDHGDVARQGTRRALHGVPAVARDRARRAGRDMGARVRHRRHRRHRGQRGRDPHARCPRARARS